MRRVSSVDERLDKLFIPLPEDLLCAMPQSNADVRALRRRVAAGVLVEPHPGMFFMREVWDEVTPEVRHLAAMRALARRYPQGVYCSFSAAVAHGLPVSRSALERLHTLTPRSAPSRSTVNHRRCATNELEYVLLDGLYVTSAPRTVVDCLLCASFPEGLALADAALRMFGRSRERLIDAVEHYGAHRRGVGGARKVARWADGRAENGGESIARARMIEEGIIPSDVQRVVIDPVEPWRRPRVDFYFLLRDGSEVLGELDGMQKYTDEHMRGGHTTVEVLVQERQRESHLTMSGATVVRFTMRDVRSPGRLRFLFAAAGVTPDSIAPGDYRDASPMPGDSEKVDWVVR